jgi:hypothetical protein
MTLPNLSYCPWLPLLNVKRYINLMAFSHMTSTSLVFNVSKCELLTAVTGYLVKDVLGWMVLLVKIVQFPTLFVD